MGFCQKKIKLIISLIFLSFWSLRSSDSPNTVVGTITYDDFINPFDLAISQDGSWLLVADNDANAIFQIDLGLNSVNPLLTFNVTYPTGIALQPGTDLAYVVSPVTNVITVFNIITLTVVATIPFSTQLIAIAVAPDGNTLYALNSDESSASYVTLIDTATNLIYETITLIGGFQNQADLVISPGGDSLYVSNINTGTITVVDLLHGNTQSTISSVSTALDGANFLAITPDGKTLCVGNGSNNWIAEVDLTATPPSAVIPANSTQAINFIAITPDGTTAYLTDQNTGTPSNSSVDILDINGNIINGSLSTGSFSITTPNSVVISADGGRGYIANGYNLSDSVVGYISLFNTNIVTPLPPTKLLVQAQTNKFLVQTNLINTITWNAPTSGIRPISYKLYRDPGLTKLIATVPANDILQYHDHNRQYNTTYSYYVVSVAASGALSQAAHVAIAD